MTKGEGLLWLDLEMTGLDPKKCKILEIAALITDNHLSLIDQCPAIAIHYDERTLDHMEAWSRVHHRRSGLTEDCRRSLISLGKAERIVLDFVKRRFAPRSAVLCGNTIWQDRRFLAKYMPKLEAYFHYRMVDVSSVKELVGRWYPDRVRRVSEKKKAHRVLADIRESIQELRWYRENIFKKK